MLESDVSSVDQRTSRDLWSLVLLVAVVAAIASFLVCEIYDLDVFWNVVIGKDIIAQREVPSLDRYTAAGLGHRYVDIHWLFQVAAAAAQIAMGWEGVQLLAVAIWGAALTLSWRASSRHSSPVVASVVVFAAAMACIERFLPRPEIVTVLGLALFWERFDSRAYRTWRQVLLLAVTQVLWANSHGLFVLGPFIAGCYFVEQMAESLRGRPAPDLRRLAWIVALLCAVSVLTPHGLGTWSYAWLLVTQVGPSASVLMKSLGELSPTFGAAFRSSPAFWFYVALLLAAVLATVDALRRRRLSLARTLAILGLAAASMTGRRNVVLFAICAAPFIAEHLMTLPKPLLRWRKTGAAATALVILAFCSYPLSGRYYLGMEIPARFGLGVTPSFFPHGLPEFLDRIGYEGQVFNSNTIGCFYLFHGFPKRLPLTEGRWTAYEEETVTRILQAPSRPELWAWVTREYEIDALLLHHTSPEARALLPRLRNQRQWRLVWCDYSSSFWLRSDVLASVPRLDLAKALDLPPPRRVDDAILLDAFLGAVGATNARIAGLRQASAFDWKKEQFLETLGRLQLDTGDRAGAEATFGSLVEKFPRNARAWNELAFFAFLRGDLEGAEQDLVRALEIEPDNQDARANLERVRSARSRH